MLKTLRKTINDIQKANKTHEHQLSEDRVNNQHIYSYFNSNRLCVNLLM